MELCRYAGRGVPEAHPQRVRAPALVGDGRRQEARGAPAGVRRRRPAQRRAQVGPALLPARRVRRQLGQQAAGNSLVAGSHIYLTIHLPSSP